MHNSFLIGRADKTARLLELARHPFLLIDDGTVADAFLDTLKCHLFDISKHHFNPLRGLDYKRARDIAAALYTASPEGKDTLTVRNGKRALTRLLLEGPTRFSDLPRAEETKAPDEKEALATVEDMLLSPVVRQILCEEPNFSFKRSVVLKLDRAEIGDTDAFLLASLAIGQTKGQVIVPDFGFYGRDFYTGLMRQNRLIAAVDNLAELSPKLQQMALGIKDKTVYRTTREDAERLIFYVNAPSNPSALTDLTGNDFFSS